MDSVRLGRQGPLVSRLGLACMGMSDLHGPADRADSLATLHAALDSGITLLDTADFYAAGHNELLIAEALRGRRSQVLLSVSCGALRDPGGNWMGMDCRPASLKNFCAYSLRRLGLDHIDIYRPARPDPQVPIEDTVGALADLVNAGHVRYIGLCGVGPELLRRAAAVHSIADVQVDYSLMSRAIEAGLLPTARELGIGITATGAMRAPLDALCWFASERQTTMLQLAIAWVLAQGDDIVPLIDARQRAELYEAMGALALDVDRETLGRLAEAVPAAALHERGPPKAPGIDLGSEK